jgi:prolyl oligopeptidase
VLRLPLAKPTLKQAKLLVPESDGTVQQLAPAGGKLFVADLLGGPSRLRAVDVKSGQTGEIKLPEVSGVGQLLHTRGDEVLLRVNSFLAPPAWYRYAASQTAAQKTALVVTSAADFSDAEVTREFATSKDGTRIPLNIIRRKSTVLDGRNPTILSGYGGYGVSETPGFSATRRLWLDQGGVYVIANLRGGGEYGEAWHKAGNLTYKQNVFNDFIAAAEHLQKRGYSSSDKLAIMGGSNGGLLMGAALTQQPQLFRAVVSSVGIYDMLRVELDPNGAFNVTEFGTVKDPRQFQALYAYSPYHHVSDGVEYPAVLFVTGDNDGRVNPAHSRKMTARLQAASPEGKPIVLRTNASSGHGIGTSLDDRIAETADVYSFLLGQLGVAFGAKP